MANVVSDWKEAVDPATGRTYYANIRTKKTQWTMPEELRRALEAAAEPPSPPPPPPPPPPPSAPAKAPTHAHTPAPATSPPPPPPPSRAAPSKPAPQLAPAPHSIAVGPSASAKPVVDSKLAALQTTVDMLTAQLDEERKTSRSLRDALDQAKDEVLRLKQAQVEAAALQEQALAATARAEQLEREKRAAEGEVIRFRSEAAKEKQRAAQAEADTAEQRREMERLKRAVEDADQKLMRMRGESTASVQREHERSKELEAKLVELQTARAMLQSKLAAAEHDASSAKEMQEQARAQLAEAQAAAAKLQKERDEAVAERSRVQREVEELRRAKERWERDKGALEKELQQNQAAAKAAAAAAAASSNSSSAAAPSPAPGKAAGATSAPKSIAVGAQDFRTQLAARLGGAAPPPAAATATASAPAGPSPLAASVSAAAAAAAAGGGGGEWKEVQDASGRTYFYHTVTQETSWSKPEELARSESVTSAASVGSPPPPAGDAKPPLTLAEQLAQRVPKAPPAAESAPAGLPRSASSADARSESGRKNSEGAGDADESPPPSPREQERPQWREVVDRSTGRKYYYNEVTKETSWEQPPQFLPVAAVAAAAALAKSASQDKIVNADRPLLEKQASAANLYQHPRRWSISQHEHEVRINAIVVHSNAEELLTPLSEDQLAKFSMESYAERFFAVASKGIFGKKTIEEMIAHRSKPLSKPLHRDLPKELEEDAVQTFRNITSYMGERKSSKGPEGHIDKLCRMAIAKDEMLRDEIYCQLVKQTTENPDREHNLRGWRLMAVLLGIFPPSKRFAFYLKAYLQKSRAHERDPEVPKFARFCEEALMRSQECGPREMPPSALEMEAAQNRRNVALTVHFTDDSDRLLLIQAQTTVLDVVRAMVTALKLPYRAGSDLHLWGLYETDPFSGAEVPLGFQQRVLDVREQWMERMHQLNRGADQEKMEIKLVFKARLFMAREMKALKGDALHLYYIQAVRDVLRGSYSCSVKESVQLAALQLVAEYGPKPVDLAQVLSEQTLRDYVNAATRQQFQMDLKGLRAQVAAERDALLKEGLSSEAAEERYLAAVRQWPVYGASFFGVQRVVQRTQEECVLGVSEQGVFALHPVSRQLTSKVVRLPEIESFTAEGDTFEFHTAGRQQTYTFKTRQAPAIGYLVQTYKREVEAAAASS